MPFRPGVTAKKSPKRLRRIFDDFRRGLCSKTQSPGRRALLASLADACVPFDLAFSRTWDLIETVLWIKKKIFVVFGFFSASANLRGAGGILGLLYLLMRNYKEMIWKGTRKKIWFFFSREEFFLHFFFFFSASRGEQGNDFCCM